MTSITGTIRIGEAQATVNATARRLRGGLWWYWVLMLVLGVGMGLLGLWLSSLAKLNLLIGWLAGAFVGGLAYQRLSKALTVWRCRQTLTGKGVPLDLPVRLEISPDTFTYAVGDVVSTAKWAAVTEVFYDKGWWIFLVQANPWFAAERFFANDDDRRAFLAEALAHMSDDARARSPAAVRIAEGRA